MLLINLTIKETRSGLVKSTTRNKSFRKKQGRLIPLKFKCNLQYVCIEIYFVSTDSTTFV